MGFSCGIIGLPNVGKSTVFNALSNAGAQMSNYPFCTIEPNRGVVPVPDERLERIGDILKKENPIPTKIEFTDVAGLVAGASKGEGLGNRFLAHIRNVDALIHLVRCFRATDVVHVTGDVDPVRDIEIINTELLLSDLEILGRAREKLLKLARSGNREAQVTVDGYDRLINHCNQGNPLKNLEFSDDELAAVNELGLITLKPVLYLANVSEGEYDSDSVQAVARFAESDRSVFMIIAGKLEEEISELPEEEKGEYLEAMGLKESVLGRLVSSSYRLLELITYYTSATELQAWTLTRGTTAQKAAGKIHTDFEKGFIRAEVYHFDDLTLNKTESCIKEKGLLRSEGRDYVVQDGDIIRYLFHG